MNSAIHEYRYSAIHERSFSCNARWAEYPVGEGCEDGLQQDKKVPLPCKPGYGAGFGGVSSVEGVSSICRPDASCIREDEVPFSCNVESIRLVTPVCSCSCITAKPCIPRKIICKKCPLFSSSVFLCFSDCSCKSLCTCES